MGSLRGREERRVQARSPRESLLSVATGSGHVAGNRATISSARICAAAGNAGAVSQAFFASHLIHWATEALAPTPDARVHAVAVVSGRGVKSEAARAEHTNPRAFATF
jgi:hypothetical protein